MLHKTKNIKRFYEKVFSANYTEKMPDWLRIHANKEENIFTDFLKKYCKKTFSNMLDLGCGDGRVLKIARNLSNLGFIEITQFHGVDRINRPKNFPIWASYYQSGIARPNDSILAIKKFDLYTSLGLSTHLDEWNLQEVIVKIQNKINAHGIIIWQENKLWTPEGIRLWWESPIKYYYSNLEKLMKKRDSYCIEIIDMKETEISRIYVLEAQY